MDAFGGNRTTGLLDPRKIRSAPLEFKAIPEDQRKIPKDVEAVRRIKKKKDEKAEERKKISDSIPPGALVVHADTLAAGRTGRY